MLSLARHLLAPGRRPVLCASCDDSCDCSRGQPAGLGRVGVAFEGIWGRPALTKIVSAMDQASPVGAEVSWRGEAVLRVS